MLFTSCLVMMVLLDLCEDQAYCQVLAESTTFRQDPCPDTYKYLEVHYKCRPNEFERRTVCEGDQMELSCKKSRRLAIYSALFGRVPNGTHSPCPADRPGYIDCQSSDTVSEVRTACQGRKRCELQAIESVFGNPCAAGINKYLDVTFTCVPKKILKQIRRHRGRLGNGRHRKKKKKKKGHHSHKQPEVTKLTTVNQGSDTTSPGADSSEALSSSTRVLETYHHTDTLERASADSAAKDQHSGYPHHIAATPTPPLLVVDRDDKKQPSDFDNSASESSGKNNGDAPWVSSNRGSSSVPKPNHTSLDSNPNSETNHFNNDYNSGRDVPKSDRDNLNSNQNNDGLNSKHNSGEFGHRDNLKPNTNQNNVDTSHNNRHYPSTSDNSREGSKDVSGNLRPTLHGTNSRDSSRTNLNDNSVSASREGVDNPVQNGDKMSSEDSGSGMGGVTEANLTVLCVNHTVGTPTVRTLPSNSEAPIGVIKEMFSVVRFMQGHQEKAILYVVLGVCVGLILLLTAVLGRVCYKLKHNTHAKLDMSEPTHSRNVSHLVHHMNHSVLDTPMLEHSDSIDRIEVVRFEPRGTMRSGYHSTLHSDSGDRSLNNYYG